MAATAELRTPSTQVATSPQGNEDGYRRLLLAALRVARAKLKVILLEIDDIGIDLQEGRLTASEAHARCEWAHIDALFPREGDGG
jgi:hypothetical protein